MNVKITTTENNETKAKIKSLPVSSLKLFIMTDLDLSLYPTWEDVVTDFNISGNSDQMTITDKDGNFSHFYQILS